MRRPSVDDNNGILKVLRFMGTLLCAIDPFIICACGTVGEMNGSPTPLLKSGDVKLVYPNRLVLFATV
jgi:hypothetical protein